jgi:hypothetical protein
MRGDDVPSDYPLSDREMVSIPLAELNRLNERERDLQNVLKWALYYEKDGIDLVNRLTTFAVEQRKPK